MKIHHLIALVALLSIILGCYFGITGKVIDAETNQPIEGAVVLVEWTKTKGYGLTYTESYKVTETLSDKDGKFDLPGCYSPFLNEPDVTIYKKGYVAWNNKYIFPSYKKRENFQWGSGYTFKMDKFKKTYSFINHQSFIDVAASLSTELTKKEKIIKAYEDWEAKEVIQERNKK